MPFIRLSAEYNDNRFTPVDNVFLSRYLSECSDKAVRIYLYGLYAAHTESVNLPEAFCRVFRLTEEELFGVYEELEELGLISILSKIPLVISYLPLSGINAKPRKIKPQKYSDFTKQMQLLFPDRMLTPSEFSEYFYLMESLHIEQEAMIMIAKYCVNLKGAGISYRYISTVAKSWAARGILSLKDVENELSSYTAQSAALNEIARAMGVKSGSDLLSGDLYVKWTEEYGFGQPALLAAASFLKGKRGSFDKLDALLSEFYRNRKMSEGEMRDYMQKKQALRDIAISVNKSLGLYAADLTPTVEQYVLPWTDDGFSPALLTRIAEYCFTSGVKTLGGMHKVISRLKREGAVTEESFNSYLSEQVAKERTVKSVLESAGLMRDVTSYDRENYHLWSDLWGLSDELILFVAKHSVGLNPIKEMHRLLSQCKAQGISTPQEAEALTALSAKPSSATHKTAYHDYEQRTYSKEEIAAIFGEDE